MLTFGETLDPADTGIVTSRDLLNTQYGQLPRMWWKIFTGEYILCQYGGTETDSQRYRIIELQVSGESE